MIADLTSPTARGAAMAFFEFGIYFGFSLAYVVGNLVIDADLYGMGWRWAFAIAGGPGRFYYSSIDLYVLQNG